MSGETATKWIIADTDSRTREATFFPSLKATQAAVRRIWFPPYDDDTAFFPAIFRLEHKEDGWKATQEPLQPEPVYWCSWKGSIVDWIFRVEPGADFGENPTLYRENDQGGLDLLSDDERNRVIAEFKVRQS